MTQPVPKYVLHFVVSADDGAHQIDYNVTVPSVQPMPQVGDEILLPKEIAQKHGLQNSVLRVISRRFNMQPLPPTIAGQVFLLCQVLVPASETSEPKETDRPTSA